MKPTARTAALAAAKTTSLRSLDAFAGGEVKVDDDKSVIFSAAVITAGRTKGHRFIIDRTTLSQVADAINSQPNGVVVRFRHPEQALEPGKPIPETLGTDVGYLRNARVVGDAVRGDVYLADYAEVLPGLGNVKDYLLRKAKSDPSGFGLSAVIAFDVEEMPDGKGNVALAARVGAVQAVDFVAIPAANPNGLLAAITADGSSSSGDSKINPQLKQVLNQIGLPWDASDAATQAFYDALDEQTKQDLGTRLKAIAAAEEVKAREAAAQAAAASTLSAKVADAVVTKLQSLKPGVSQMNAKLKKYLSANHKLAADASDTDAQSAYESLSADQKAAADKSCTDEPTNKAPLSAVVPPTGGGNGVVEQETLRVAQLRNLGDTLRVDQNIVQLAIAHGDDVTAARTRYLAHLRDAAKPIEGLSVRVGENQQVAALNAALPQAIMLRAGAKVDKPHELANQMRHLSVLDMYRHYLIALGAKPEDVHYIPRPQLVDLLGPRNAARRFNNVAMLAQGVGSFDAILLDAANKTARAEYQLAPSTWAIWARRTTAPDFKNINRVQLSDSPGLIARDEGGEIKYSVLSDSKESYVLAEYINGLRLTRKAMVNDDLDVFSRIPRAQMYAAKQLEDDVVYAALNSSTAMSDTYALFHSNHSNYSTATAEVGAPSVTTLGIGRKKMRLQTGPKGNKLNLLPRYLIVPAALETVADQYTSANYVATAQTTINPFAQGGRTPLTPVIEPRMDGYSSTAWILAADSATIDTIECAFLDGESEPVLKQETDFDTDDMKFAVRHTVAAKAIDYRGLYKNAGA